MPVEPLPRESWFTTTVLRPLRGRHSLALGPRVVLERVEGSGMLWLTVLPTRTSVLARFQRGTAFDDGQLRLTTRLGPGQPLLHTMVLLSSRTQRGVLATLVDNVVQFIDAAAATNPEAVSAS